ncbi:L,D-transpeptidase [uncultured Jannaschia sp.]|uniref:L,D-transpeptidase n=1 Tax=uncultured Jannaschia sp. TaxID=293347 RepID=UPI002632FBF6|nr:L,D-transpeptidase [uncultured Jannaschia sp.]
MVRGQRLGRRAGAGAGLRIHGSPAARSIGGRASSGCVRMVMAHIIDLYDLVETGSTAFLYPPEDASGTS